MDKDTILGLIVIIVLICGGIWACKACNSSEEKELAPDDTGNWKVQEFTDNFGTGTGKRFITQRFSGRFSIPGAEGTAYIEFLITGSDTIAFELYRYGYSNSDKVGHNYFEGAIEDAEGNRFPISASITSVNLLRNTFDKTSSNNIHNALLKGKVKIRFSAEGMAGRMNNEYTFDLSDWGARGYSNAFRKLTQ